MGSYPRCAPRSGRCEGRQGVVCARVCLAEASVGLIGGCVQVAARVSYRLGGKIFLPSETPLQYHSKTTCLTPVDAILRSGRCAVAPTGLVLRWHRPRPADCCWPAHQRSRKSRTKSELLSLIGHSVQYLSF